MSNGGIWRLYSPVCARVGVEKKVKGFPSNVAEVEFFHASGPPVPVE